MNIIRTFKDCKYRYEGVCMGQKNMPECGSECLEFLCDEKLLENYEKELESLENVKNICFTNVSSPVIEISRKESEVYKTILKLVNKRINEINKEFGK